ncbi:MAG: HAMP domain-containing histidine kinase [Nitrospirae bacterium]|nr:HAMP domain-containing histidine kinase [Nitrospirota bacterium]
MFVIQLTIGALFLVLPSSAWAFVSHDYPATFVNEVARIFFLISCVVVLGAMIYNQLHKEKIWQKTVIALLLFILWDIIVFAGQIAEHQMAPYQIVGSDIGLDYFRSRIIVSGKGCFFYFARYDYLLIDLAMFFFYAGLRGHLKRAESAETLSSAILPLLPVFIVEIGGACVFMVLSALSLITAIKLFKKDKANILWNYMIWLSSAFVLFSISRGIGHIAKNVLIAAGNADTWQSISPVSGSFNIFAFFLLGSVSLFFIKMYDIHLKALRDKHVIEDINAELTDLNQELETIVAERTMSLMALTVADKIRNPAAIIGIVCKRVLDRKEELVNVISNLNAAVDECEKLQTIVGDFENLLRTKKSVFKYEDINEIIRSVLPTLEKEAAHKEVHVAVDLSKEPLKINAEKSLLRVALFHVIRNAIEATPVNGTVTISSRLDNDKAVVTITDNGIGIRKADLDRIFDTFYSTKSFGFGMGLPLVKQIISEHLGEIKMGSEEGKGTTLTILLPTRWKG